MDTVVVIKPQEDTSQRARSLARLVDRQPPGVYYLIISVPTNKNDALKYDLIQPVTIRSGTLPKEYLPE
jgi:hypothetical protein